MTQYTLADGVASDMMWDAGRGGAGPWVCCSCGKEHTLPADITEEMYDAGEHENIYYVELNGQQFVYDCEGCAKKLRRYEDFIWQEREHIRNYLKIRVDQEKAWWDQQQTLNTLAGIK